MLIFDIGRRYIRFFKFIDNFSLAYTAFRTRSGFMGTLEVVKWSCWGIYLMFESSVIVGHRITFFINLTQSESDRLTLSCFSWML